MESRSGYGESRGVAAWRPVVALAFAVALAAVFARPALASEGRVEFGAFGPDGSGSPTTFPSSSLDQLAFDQAARRIIAVKKGSPPGACLIRLRTYVALPAVAMSPVCHPSLELTDTSRTDVAVDNSGGPADGNIYVLSTKDTFPPEGELLFGFDRQGDLLPSFPLPLSAGDPDPVTAQGISVDSSGTLWISRCLYEVLDVGVLCHPEITALAIGPTDLEAIGSVDTSSYGAAIDVALDDELNLYAAFSNAVQGKVVKYIASDGYSPTTAELLVDSPPRITAIAADKPTGHLLVARAQSIVQEYDDTGSELSAGSPITPVPGGSFHGVSVDEENGIFYIGDRFGPPAGAGGRIYAVSRYGVHPDVATGSATEVTNRAARLSGTVNPDGPPASCEFEWGTTANYGEPVPCAVDPGGGDGEVEVHADLEGLEPSTDYHFRLDASNATGTVTGNDAGFSTFGPPKIDREAFDSATATEVTISARIHPGNQLTKYWIESGPTDSYGEVGEVEELSAGENAVRVTGTISGLEPDAVHHARFRAENATSVEEELAPTIGADIVSRTYPNAPAAGGEACPNHLLRVGLSRELPDCRAFEMVTPDTSGLYPSVETLGASDNGFPAEVVRSDGESVLFMTGGGSIPGPGGNGNSDVYRATRSADGWSSEEIAPSGVLSRFPFAGGHAPEHEYAFWKASAEGILPAQTTYVRMPNGNLEFIGRGGLEDDPKAIGKLITPRAEHIVFTSARRLESAAPANGTVAVYERPAGGLASVVSLLPGGVTPATDATYLRASPNGRAIAFGVAGAVYVRLDGEVTQKVADEGTFAGISAGGQRVFYLKGGELFIFDTNDENTTPVTTGATPTIIDISPDGSRVFFSTPRELEAGKGELGEPNLYVWSDGPSHYVATLAAADFEGKVSEFDFEGKVSLGNWLTDVVGPVQNLDSGPATQAARTTGDGRFLLFESARQPEGFDNVDPVTGIPHKEIYRYDAELDDLRCVSCSPVGAAARSDARLQVVDTPLAPLVATRNMSADGAFVFFETADALVARDINGVSDVYRWTAGDGARLITSGRSTTKLNRLYGATPSGSDVLVWTPDALSPLAGEGGVPAIYDARVGGGIAPPAVDTPCVGDGCRDGTSGAPALPAPASHGLVDPGNVRARKKSRPRRCKKRGRRAGPRRASGASKRRAGKGRARRCRRSRGGRKHRHARRSHSRRGSR